MIYLLYGTSKYVCFKRILFYTEKEIKVILSNGTLKNGVFIRSYFLYTRL